MNDTAGVPVAVVKRLQLALAGWRYGHGRWTKGTSEMSEELIDYLPVTAIAVVCGADPANGLAVSAMH